jgi:hypothetical protein
VKYFLIVNGIHVEIYNWLKEISSKRLLRSPQVELQIFIFIWFSKFSLYGKILEICADILLLDIFLYFFQFCSVFFRISLFENIILLWHFDIFLNIFQTWTWQCFLFFFFNFVLANSYLIQLWNQFYQVLLIVGIIFFHIKNAIFLLYFNLILN